MAEIYVKGTGGGTFLVDSSNEHVRSSLLNGELIRVQAGVVKVGIVKSRLGTDPEGMEAEVLSSPGVPIPGHFDDTLFDEIEDIKGTKSQLLEKYSPDGVRASSTRPQIVEAIIEQGLHNG
tara:strand:+ start:3791 stop:4153 length:363 start_codon:yes stop_codon:yes gene_type:complete